MRPELPDYGTFPRWPAEGSDWIHPDDLSGERLHLPPDVEADDGSDEQT